MAEFLVIGGSGAYTLERGEFGEVLGVQVLETPFGLTAPIYTIRHPEGFEYHFLSRHGERDYDVTAPFVNYRANIYGAKELGVKRILAWTGPGSLRLDYRPGDFVIPRDLIDLTKGRKDTFFENAGLGFVRQSPVFCPQVQDSFRWTLKELSLPFHDGGTYCCTQGPRLETPAEVKAIKALGGELVGMTLAPELFLAKELEICYGALCYVTNYAEGIKDFEFKEGVLFEGMLPEEDRELVDRAVRSFPRVVKGALSRLRSLKRSCPCGKLMERFRRKGKVGEDWKEWILGPID